MCRSQSCRTGATGSPWLWQQQDIWDKSQWWSSTCGASEARNLDPDSGWLKWILACKAIWVLLLWWWWWWYDDYILCDTSPWWCPGPCHLQGPCVGLWSDCIQDLYWCPQPVLSPKAIWIHIAYAATWGHDYDWVCTVTKKTYLAPCSYWGRGLCWCLWLVQFPETMCKSKVQAPADSKGQQSYFCHGIADCRLTVGKEGHIRLLWQLLTPPPKK